MAAIGREAGACDDRDRSAAIWIRHADRPVRHVRAGARPGQWNEQMGLWLVTRYDDVRWALGEPKLSSTMPSPAADSTDGSSGLLADMYTFVKSSLVFTDPPDHTRLRRLVIAAFVPSVINNLAEPIAAITNRMLDEHADSLDLAAHLAEPMPIAVLGQLLVCRYRSLKALSSNGGAMTSCCPSGVTSIR